MRDVNKFANFTHGKSMTKALVLEYKTMLEKEYTLASANSMMAAINSFFYLEGGMNCL